MAAERRQTRGWRPNRTLLCYCATTTPAIYSFRLNSRDVRRNTVRRLRESPRDTDVIGKEGIWGSLQEWGAKAFTKANTEWFEKTLGLKPDKFFEHVVIEIIAALSAAAILGFIGFIASRHVWRAIRRRFRAAIIRRTSSAAFVIVRCPIANDSSEAIGNEIAARLETAFRAFAGWGEAGGRPFHVMGFPLALSGDEGSKAYDKAIETAKRWLERTDGDILIWGKRVKGESVGIVRLIGKDRKKGVIEVRRVDFDRRAADFDQALANAIAYEAAQLTQVTLSEPELLNLEILHEVSNKLKKLASSDAPALSSKWRERMGAEHWRLTEEIVRRTSSQEERQNLEAQARLEIAALDPIKYRHRYAETALRVGTLTRKRNWADPNPAELDEARAFLTKASAIFEAVPDIKRAAEAALERSEIRGQQLVFLRKQEAENDSIYQADFEEVRRLTELANDERLDARLIAERCRRSSDDAVAEICGFDKFGPSGAFELVNRISRHLDNNELLELAVDLDASLFSRGDNSGSVEFWRAAPQLTEAILNSRSNWTLEERLYLSARIASISDSIVPRLSLMAGREAAAPFEEIRDRFTAKIKASLKPGRAAILRYIDIRTLGILADSNFDRLEYEPKTLELLRLCAGPDAERFPNLQMEAKSHLIVVLNNRAKRFNLPEAAEEALCLSLELEREESYSDDIQAHYISSYACWQAARLTPQNDSLTRAKRSIRAHSLSEIGLKLANEQGNQHYTGTLGRLLNFIEEDFPELAFDTEATDATASKAQGLPPDSSLTN